MYIPDIGQVWHNVVLIHSYNVPADTHTHTHIQHDNSDTQVPAFYWPNGYTCWTIGLEQSWAPDSVNSGPN